MKQVLTESSRTMALWLAMMIGTIASGVVIHPVPHPGIPDGPVPTLAAMVLVNAVGAIVVAGLAARLAARRLLKGAMLLVVVFTVETGLSSIESIYFRQFLHLSTAELVTIAAAGLVRAAVTALSATLLWPRAGDPVETRLPGVRPVAAVIAIYVADYWIAGMLVAWRSDLVRTYYNGGLDFNLPALLALQAFRGAIWASLALLLANNLRGRTITVAAWTAGTFAVLMAAPLIYPNAIMPWAVREAHLVELLLSNTVFGLVSVVMLRASGQSQRKTK